MRVNLDDLKLNIGEDDECEILNFLLYGKLCEIWNKVWVECF